MTNRLNIDLWFWRLSASPAKLDRWRTFLDAGELDRMARFMFEKDRTRFTICRSRMRRILGWYTSTPPRQITFGTIARDKPTLTSANPDDLQFNLTHTTGLACLAITHTHPIGVDLEHVRDGNREIKRDFIEYTLNTAEQKHVLPLGDSDQQDAFFRYWTAKEAFLKCSGTGLWKSLKTFDVDVPLNTSFGEFSKAAVTRIDDETERSRNWQLYTFRASAEHIGAIAITPPIGSAINFRTRWLDQ